MKSLVRTKSKSILKNCLQKCAASTVAATARNEASLESDGEKPVGWEDALPYKAIPGPKAIPILGNTWRFVPKIGQYSEDSIAVMAKLHKEFGDIVKVDKVHGFRDLIFLYNPDDFEMLFRNEGQWPIRADVGDSITYYRKIVRKDTFKHPGLLSVQGKDWFDIRSAANPVLMQPRSVQMYNDAVDEITGEFIERIKYLAAKDPNKEMPDNFMNELNKWAFESVMYVALNTRVGCFDPNLKPDSHIQKLIDNINRMFHLLYLLEKKPQVWKIFTTPTLKEFVSVMDYITDFMVDKINAAMVSNTDGKAEHEMNVLERLVKRNREYAVALAADLLSGGVDTTSKITAAGIYFLAKNQNVQNKLRNELKQILPNASDKVTKDKLQQMSYLKATVKEVTRLTPIAGGNTRVTQKELVLGGYQIPKDVNIITANLKLCRDDKYFPDANSFKPERWMRDNDTETSHKNTNPFIVLPFGFGPRSCLGKRLATMEAEILLAKVVRNFSIHWNKKDADFKSELLYGISGPLNFQMIALE